MPKRMPSEKDTDRACSGIFAGYPAVKDYAHKERISKRLQELVDDFMAMRPGSIQAMTDFHERAKRGEHIP